MYFNLKPQVFKPSKIIGTVFGIGILYFALRPMMEDEVGRNTIYFILALSLIFLIASWINRLNVRLYIREDYVGYKSLLKDKKIKLSQIESIKLNKQTRGVSRSIAIV